MKTPLKKPDPSEAMLTQAEFLLSYNKNIPEGFPKASSVLLQKYRGEHGSFFKKHDLWSLAEHRKKIMDWLPLNIKLS